MSDTTSICRHCRFAERDHLHGVKCLYTPTEYRPLRCSECLYPILYVYNGNCAHDDDDRMFAEYQDHDPQCLRHQ